MEELKIEYVPVGDLKRYANNARKHGNEDVQAIAESISAFGFNDPIGIWHDTIVEGHGRLEAAKRLKMKTVPIIRLDHLTDEERKAYALAHNKTAELSEWDFEMLDMEINDIDLDMELFGFEFDDDEKPSETDVRSSLQHNVFENQERMQFKSDNYYGFPNLQPTQTSGNKLLRFCDWKEVEDPENWIAHWYYDDYKFIAAWKEPDKYLERLKQFKAVISPDFSLYTDFPRALQILSCYRRQWCGAYWQSNGIDVIPDVVWGDEETYNWCFDGIPKKSVVAVSSVGVTNDSDWNGKKGDMWRQGYNEMLKRLQPTKIIIYGTQIGDLDGDIIRVPSFYEERRDKITPKKET